MLYNVAMSFGEYAKAVPPRKRINTQFFYGYPRSALHSLNNPRELDGGIIMEGKKYFSAKRLTGIAVLLALVIVLQTFGGTVSIGVVQMNFTLIPIVLGAIMYGALTGAFLGLVCGVVVLIQVIMGMVPFYTIIWSNDPIVVTFTCLLKTTVAGYVAGLLFKIFEKKNAYVSIFLAAGIVPIINTALFVVGCLLMTNSVHVMAGNGNVLWFILGSIVTFNFFVEFAVNLLVAPALYTVYKVVERRIGK